MSILKSQSSMVNLSSVGEKLLLPFIYEDDKKHNHFLKKTKELVINTNKFNNYYESYKNSIHIEKFSMPRMQSTYDLPQISGLDLYASKLDMTVKLNNSMSMKDSV